MKSEIDKLAENFIKQLESYAKKFKAEQKKNVNLEHYNALVESSRKQLIEYKKCFSLFSVENENKNISHHMIKNFFLIKKSNPNRKFGQTGQLRRSVFFPIRPKITTLTP